MARPAMDSTLAGADEDDDQSVLARVRREIEDSIRNSEFKAGERLTEAALTARLRVSRSVLRVALQLLQIDGLIELRPNRGAVVRRITRQDLADFFQLRALFEGFAAARTAARIGEPGVREAIGQLFDEVRMLQSGHGGRPFAEHDEDLHRIIVQCSGNRLLPDHWNKLRMPAYRFRFLGGANLLDVEKSIGEHGDLLGAILEGDDGAAEEISNRHMRRINSIVQRLSEDEFQRIFNLMDRV